jgi:hypothetical protein
MRRLPKRIYVCIGSGNDREVAAEQEIPCTKTLYLIQKDKQVLPSNMALYARVALETSKRTVHKAG